MLLWAQMQVVALVQTAEGWLGHLQVIFHPDSQCLLGLLIMISHQILCRFLNS